MHNSEIRAYVLENGMNHGCIKRDLIYCEDPEERFSFPSWTTLIRHPMGNILFDAACNKDPERQQLDLVMKNLHMTEADDPANRLAQLGMKPEDIHVVVLSHMHTDHYGFVEKFTKAEVIVHEDEFTFMMRDYALGQSPAEKDLAFLIQQRLKWKLFPSNLAKQELYPGVTIYNFGKGHSYGMLGLLLELPESGNKLLVSDAIYSSENVGPPVRRPGICRDMENWLKTMNRILELSKELNAEIWYGHDLAQFQGLIKSTEGYYR